MPIRAVLFDVGGPIDTEVTSEAIIDRQILGAVTSVGVAADADAVFRASEAAVAAFAPSAYKAMVWTLCGGDPELAAAAYSRFHDDGGRLRERLSRGIELRPGIVPLVRSLHAAGLLLGLAANQPSAVIRDLDRHRLASCFTHREVSGHHGFHKPDVRLFLRACEDLGVEPAECVMVGDRIDNDIAPARLLGMRAVLFRTGRHIRQQPRSLDELPDAEVHDVPGLEAALDRLIA